MEWGDLNESQRQCLMKEIRMQESEWRTIGVPERIFILKNKNMQKCLTRMQRRRELDAVGLLNRANARYAAEKAEKASSPKLPKAPIPPMGRNGRQSPTATAGPGAKSSQPPRRPHIPEMYPEDSSTIGEY